MTRPLSFVERPPSLSGATERSPVLVLLHGVGGNEVSMLQAASPLGRGRRLLSLRAPLELAPGQFAWFEVRFTPAGPIIRPEQAEASRRALIDFLSNLGPARGLEPGKICLFGFSQGAIMSIALALTRPDRIGGVIAVGGRTLPELFAAEGPLAGNLTAAESLRGFPLFVGHGRRDAVLPISYARATRQRFERFPVELTYREYEMAHVISGECLVDVEAWLAERWDQDPGAP